MSDRLEGRILCGTGGFYYVEHADGIVECRARGVFRREGLTPLAGDLVRISMAGEGQGTLEEVLPRRNFLVRPPVANVDCLVVVISLVKPAPNWQVIDSMIAIAEDREIPVVAVVNKSDLMDAEAVRALYAHAGFEVFVVSATAGTGLEPLKERLRGQSSVCTGNSGVGKSSILNALDMNLQLPTAAISEKLGRGRHTTRTSVLYPQADGGYLIDTPGFSSLDMEKAAGIEPENLPYCFREFAPYLGACKFRSCRHGTELGCAVRAAVERGDIEPSRYESYLAMREKAEEAAKTKY